MTKGFEMTGRSGRAAWPLNPTGWGVIAGGSLAVLLSACSAPLASPASAPVAQVQQPAPYPGALRGPVRSTVARWDLGGESVQVVLTLPTRDARVPLVLYLPGLGQSSDDGALWRSHWAGAGLAVLSVQALAEDATAWSSELARAGEFKALGRERFSGAQMTRRLRVLAQVVARAQRLSESGQGEWSNIDWSRVGVAGFDLGAYAAQVMAGERLGDGEPVATGLTLRALISLSPYAPREAADLRARYAAIGIAALFVTSDADTDLLGLMPDASARRIPFDHLPGGNKYLLSLHGLRHVSLSGDERDLTARAGSATAKRSADAATNEGDSAGGARKRGGHSRGPAAEGRAPQTLGGVGSEAGRVGELSPEAAQQRFASARDVSTAFWDAYLSGIEGARTWLNDQAGGALGASAEWQRR